MPRGKTFTGCWTCRDRRLKCDELRPTCLKCSAKGLVCAGYGSRLHWLDPVNLNTLHEPPKTAEKGLQRRRLLPANGIERLTDDQLDILLSKVNEDGASGRQCVEGPFSVFSLNPYATGDDTILEQDANANARDFMQSGLGSHTDSRAVQSSTHPTNLPSRVPIHLDSGTSDEIRGVDLSRIPTSSDHNAKGSPSLGQGTPIPERGSAYSTTTSPISYTPFLMPETPASTAASGESSLNRAKFLTAEIKFLLNHYRANVLPFFSVLDNMRTPWRVLHFPKALQAACEHEIGDPTNSPSHILLCAVLTVSAYSLHNSEQKRQLRKSSQHWGEVATYYKGEALKLLKTHIGTLSHERADFDYHELLAAMLSMVTIDVMCGDTRTCEIHLQACETLIKAHMETNVDKLSLMSKALHTTFIYLRVMQQAAPVINFDAQAQLGHPEDPHETSTATTSDFISFVELGDPDDVCFDPFSSEMIYGFPVRLLFFLRNAVQIANCKSKTNNCVGISPGPQTRFDLSRGEIEDALLDWPVEDIIAKYKEETSLKPGNLEIMEHYTRAFHLAIIIFWFDKVHRAHPRLLQQYVGSVINHLEQAEQAKAKHHIAAGPLLWPAFIAASHATDSTTQNRFICWLEASDRVGVGTSRATIDLLNRLWNKAGSSNGEEVASAISRLHLVLT